MTGRARAFAAITGSVTLWGLAPVWTRYLVLRADPLALLGIRFAICSLLYLPVLAGLRHTAWTRRQVAAAVGCGLAGIVGYNVPMAYGIQRVPAAAAGVLICTEPIWIALLSVAVLRHRLTPGLLCGTAAACAGVVTLAVDGGLSVGLGMFLGCALVLLGAFMWGVYSVSVGPLVRRFGTVPVSAVTLWAGTLPLVVLSSGSMAGAARTMTGAAWLVLALLALGSNLVGTLLWNYGLAQIPSAQAGMFLYLYPVISFLGGATLLSERITAHMVVGGAMVVSGLLIAQAGDPARRPASGRARDPEPARPEALRLHAGEQGVVEQAGRHHP